jgi:CspA family cold shock protein
MSKGTIKRIITNRGYGFIQTEEKGDIFFHATDLLNGVSFDSLTEGQQVEFEIKPTSRGLRAINVKPTE